MLVRDSAITAVFSVQCYWYWFRSIQRWNTGKLFRDPNESWWIVTRLTWLFLFVFWDPQTWGYACSNTVLGFSFFIIISIRRSQSIYVRSNNARESLLIAAWRYLYLKKLAGKRKRVKERLLVCNVQKSAGIFKKVWGRRGGRRHLNTLYFVE